MTMQHTGTACKTKTFTKWSDSDDSQRRHSKPRWGGANSFTSAETRINRKHKSSPSCGASYLRVSVVVFVCVTLLLKDPLSAQPCSPLWVCICGADQRRLWKRRDQGSESPPSEQPRLVHFPVSPTLRGHSSQPISNRRVRERAFGERGGAYRTESDMEQWAAHLLLHVSLQPVDLLLEPSSTFCFLPVHVRVCVWVFFCFSFPAIIFFCLHTLPRVKTLSSLTVNAAGGSKMLRQ